MRLVFTGYSATHEYSDPYEWLKRIRGYTGILEALAKDHEVHSIERISYNGSIEQAHVHYEFIKHDKKIIRFPAKMHKYIRSLHPDVVFVNGTIFPWQVIQLRKKIGPDVKIIILHRSEKPLNGFRRWLQRKADRVVDAYLFSSAEFGKEWNDIISPPKMHEVVQGSSGFIQQDKMKSREKLGVNGAPLCLWVGNLDNNKDPLTLIKGFLQFKKIQPGASLYIVHQSDALLGECRRLAGENNNIHFVGKVEHQSLETWFSAADIFISTSHYEGNGIAAIESMSCGCIPVLTDIYSFRRMTGPGETGYLFEPGNADALCKALNVAFSIDTVSVSMKTMAWFEKELSFDAISRKINAIIGYE